LLITGSSYWQGAPSSKKDLERFLPLPKVGGGSDNPTPTLPLKKGEGASASLDISLKGWELCIRVSLCREPGHRSHPAPDLLDCCVTGALLIGAIDVYLSEKKEILLL
jgi:hypothetical protein